MSTLPNAATHASRRRSSDGDVADVRRHAQRPASARLDLGRDVLDVRLAPPGRDDVGAGIREAERERAADAARAADDHCHASRKIEQAHRREAGLRVPRARGGRGNRRRGSLGALVGRLLGLMRARLDEMLVHRLTRGVGIAAPDRLVDAPVHVGRVAHVPLAGLPHRLAAPLVVQRRDHLHRARRQSGCPTRRPPRDEN